MNNKFDLGRFHLTQALGVTQGQLQENRWYGFDGTTAPTVAFRNSANEGGFEAPSTDVQGPGGINQYGRAVLENNLETTRTLFGSAKFDFDISKSITASVNFGVDYTNRRIFQFTPTFFMSSIDAVRNDNQENDLTDARQEFLNLLVEPTISYNQEFGNHKLSGVLGYTYFLEDEQGFGIYGQGTDSNSIRVVRGLTPSSELVLLGEKNTAGLESFFGRINYNFNSRYLLSAIVRRDASSRFGSDNQAGYFPSISAAWNISNESFWNVESINYLKLRASYGELGSYPDVFYPTEAVFISNQSNVVFGDSAAPGLTQLSLADQGLKWETTKTFDVGIDLSLFDSKINFTLDYYTKDIQDVLVDISVPSTTGVSLPVTRNAGNLVNDGLEFNLNYKQKDKEFKYEIGTNFSFNLESKAGNVPNPILGPTIDEDLRIVNRTEANQPIGAFYGFIVEDRVNPDTGDFVRRDINRDGQIDNDDITVIGNPIPDFTYGLTFDAEYKNFDLGLNFAGVQGNEIYNLTRYYNILWQDGGKLTEVLNSWTPTNRNTNVPRASVSDGEGNKAGSDVIDKLRLSFNIQNVFVITNYSGYDPDVSSTDGGRASLNSGVPAVRDNVNPLLGRGLDARAYPNARSFSFNIKATF